MPMRGVGSHAYGGWGPVPGGAKTSRTPESAFSSFTGVVNFTVADFLSMTARSAHAATQSTSAASSEANAELE